MTLTAPATLSRRAVSWLRRLTPLWWLGPSLLLMAAVIVYPAIEMIRTSFLKVNSIGLTQGFAGLGNYRNLLHEPALGHVLVNTVLWVVLVVAATIAISLGLAQFLNKRFAGRRLVRWALIVPWAASLVMTATVWRYIYEGSYGMLNRVLLDLGLIHSPIQWYQDTSTSFWCLVAVGIIVSIPFSTYVILAGAQAIPADVYEAAQVDGADLPEGHLPAAAAGPAHLGGAQHDLRVQLVPDHLGDHRQAARQPDRHHGHVHVQDRLHVPAGRG
jgi:ABC-type sugar transport system permease subunit